MKVLVIDNYDSFTYNLVQALGALGQDPVVRRNDRITAEEVLAMRPDRLVISPGPCTPRESGVTLDILRRCAGKFPILGVCLGHQCMAEAFEGGAWGRAGRLMHGKTSPIRHDGLTIYRGLPDPFTATRYHSLIVKGNSWACDGPTGAWRACSSTPKAT